MAKRDVEAIKTIASMDLTKLPDAEFLLPAITQVMDYKPVKDADSELATIPDDFTIDDVSNSTKSMVVAIFLYSVLSVTMTKRKNWLVLLTLTLSVSASLLVIRHSLTSLLTILLHSLMDIMQTMYFLLVQEVLVNLHQ